MQTMGSAEQAAVHLVEHPLLGQSAAAARAFKAGSVILKEAPLLQLPDNPEQCTPELRARARRVVAQLNPPGAPTREGSLEATLVRYALVFVDTPVETRAQLLSALYSPPFDAEVAATLAGKAAARVAAGVASYLVSEEKRTEGDLCSETTLLKVLLALKANAYESHVFATCCKLAHSCGDANVNFTLADGQGLVVAARDIQEGEVLSACYMGAEDTLASTPYRQRELLHRFLFTCMCTMCTEHKDVFRTLPCPTCVPRTASGVLPNKAAFGQEPLAGTLTYDPQQEASGTPWSCSTCGTQLPDELAAVFGVPGAVKVREVHSERTQGMPPDALSVLLTEESTIEWAAVNEDFEGLPQVIETYKEVARVLGPAHWATWHLLLDATSHRAALSLGRELKEIEAGVENVLGFSARIKAAGELTLQRELFFAEGLIRLVGALAQGIHTLPAGPASTDIRNRALLLAARVLGTVEGPLEASRHWEVPYTAALDQIQRLKAVLSQPPAATVVAQAVAGGPTQATALRELLQRTGGGEHANEEEMQQIMGLMASLGMIGGGGVGAGGGGVGGAAGRGGGRAGGRGGKGRKGGK